MQSLSVRLLLLVLLLCDLLIPSDNPRGSTTCRGLPLDGESGPREIQVSSPLRGFYHFFGWLRGPWRECTREGAKDLNKFGFDISSHLKTFQAKP